MQQPIYRVTSVELLGGYRLRVGFDDGTARDIDLEPVLAGEIYGPLRNGAGGSRLRSGDSPRLAQP